MHIYFNYRWHMLLNAEFIKVLREGYVIPLTIDNLLKDVEVITGERDFIQPYQELLTMLKEVYPVY